MCLLRICIVKGRLEATYRLHDFELSFVQNSPRNQHTKSFMQRSKLPRSMRGTTSNAKLQFTRTLIAVGSFYRSSLRRHDDIKATPTSTHLRKLQPPHQHNNKSFDVSVFKLQANGHPG